MAASNRTPVVPKRVTWSDSSSDDRSAAGLPILIQIPTLKLQPTVPALGERLSKLVHDATTPPPQPAAQVLTRRAAQAGSSIFQFLLRHPRLVAGTTLAAAVLLAAGMLLRQSTGTAIATEDQLATTSRQAQCLLPPLARLPPGNPARATRRPRSCLRSSRNNSFRPASPPTVTLTRDNNPCRGRTRPWIALCACQTVIV